MVIVRPAESVWLLFLTCQLLVHRIGGLEDHLARYAGANFDVLDGAVAKSIQHRKEPPDLAGNDEVAQVASRPRWFIDMRA